MKQTRLLSRIFIPVALLLANYADAHYGSLFLEKYKSIAQQTIEDYSKANRYLAYMKRFASEEYEQNSAIMTLRKKREKLIKTLQNFLKPGVKTQDVEDFLDIYGLDPISTFYGSKQTFQIIKVGLPLSSEQFVNDQSTVGASFDRLVKAECRLVSVSELKNGLPKLFLAIEFNPPDGQGEYRVLKKHVQYIPRSVKD